MWERRAGSKHMSCTLEHFQEYKSVRIARRVVSSTGIVDNCNKCFIDVLFHMLVMKSSLYDILKHVESDFIMLQLT